MAKMYATPWHRYKFLLSALVLLLPIWFLYQAMNPEFPAPLATQTLGDYEITPMPFDLDGAYQHDGQWVKDFLLTFSAGDIANIRQAVLNIGDSPMSVTQVKQLSGEEGLLHGSRYGQHVHAIAKAQFTAQDSIWLTIENWDGDVITGRWEMPAVMVH